MEYLKKYQDLSSNWNQWRITQKLVLVSNLHILIHLKKGIAKRSFQDPQESNQLIPMYKTHHNKLGWSMFMRRILWEKWRRSKRTPKPKLERGEQRNTIRPWRLLWSENKSEKNTKYNAMNEIKIAWTVEIPLSSYIISQSDKRQSITYKKGWNKEPIYWYTSTNTPLK